MKKSRTLSRCRSQNIPGHTERHRHAAPHRQPRNTSRTRASVQAGPTPTPTALPSQPRPATDSNESLFTSAAVEAAAAVSSQHRSASAAKARPPRRRRRSTRARRPHACPACTGIPARAPPRRARATGGTRTAGGAKATGRSTPAARGPATCAAMGTGGERQPGIGQARVPVEVRSRRRAPRQPTGRPGGHAARTRALGAPSSAVGRHACSRPRRGAAAAVLPHWDDDDRVPGGRLTRALPPPANGHGRGAWCERRNRTASARWAPHLPCQPASRLHWHAFVRAAFHNFGSDRRGLPVHGSEASLRSASGGSCGCTVPHTPYRLAGAHRASAALAQGSRKARLARAGLEPCARKARPAPARLAQGSRKARPAPARLAQGSPCARKARARLPPEPCAQR